MQPRGSLAGAVLSLALLAAPGAGLAQMDPSEHAAHHPGGDAPAVPAPAAPAPPAAPGGATGMGGMMAPPPGAGPQAAGEGGGMMGGKGGGMMGGEGGGCCGGGAAKPFYPALMDMPSLTPEARRFIEAEADRRLGLGAEAITTGQAPLHHALSANDPAAMQQAIAGMREGVLRAESGASALQALNEGQQPRHIALTWFKKQMSTPAGEAGRR